MYNSRVLFLIGAGASIPVDIPGMAGFAREFSEYIQDKPEARAFQELREFGVPADLEEILQSLNVAIDFPNQPTSKLVESIVSPNASREVPTEKLKEYQASLRDRFRDWKRLRAALLKWVRERCLNYNRSNAFRIYSGLLSRLATLGYPLFTTNYDAVFHYVARAAGLTVSDNFLPDPHGRYFWDPDLNGFHQSNAVRLVHIHGSIIWHLFPDEKIERLRSITPKSEEGIPLREILIFPTRFKDIYDQPFFPLYSGFTRSLERAHVLYIIGHSLRDEYLLAVIREQLWEGTLLLVVIDPQLPARDVLMDREISENVIHITKGIEEAYPILNQALSIEENDSNHEDTYSYIDNVRTFWEDVRRVIKKGKLDKVMFENWPVHADRGEEIDLILQVDTLFGGETFKIFLSSENEDLRRPLEFTYLNENRQEFSGRRNFSVPLRLIVPDDLERNTRHKLLLILEDLEDSVVYEKEYILKIRKHPKSENEES